MNTRKGLGRYLGMGYKNLVPLDTHIHSLSAKGVKTYQPYFKGYRRLYAKSDTTFSEYTKANFDIDENNILNSKGKHNSEPIFNIMYNPRTGEMLLGDRQNHSDLLRGRDMLVGEKSLFNEWVRGKYDKDNNVLYVRHYFNPKSHYAEFNSKAFDISEDMQKKMIDVLKEWGLPDYVKVKYNQTNETLKNEGFIYYFEI